MAGIGFFAPLPLAMMLPFMAGQSMIMGDAFGKAYQYGKRKISAMSNEEFNKMDANTLGRELIEDYTKIVPHLKVAVHQSLDFQKLIITELVKIIPTIPQSVGEGLAGPNNDILSQLIKFLASGGQILPTASAEDQGASTFDDTTTSGPTGPQQPILDSLYAGMSVQQLRTLKLSTTWLLLPKTQRDLIQKILNANPPKTVDQGIKDTPASSFIKDVAFKYNRMKLAFGRWRNTGAPNFLKVFNIAAKDYNKFVQRNGKAHLSIDIAKSIKAKKLISK